MSLNPFERAFSVEEVARIADADLSHFRVMLHRAGEDAPGHKRRDGRILFSAEEVLEAAIAVSLIRFGMKTAEAFSWGRGVGALNEGGKPPRSVAYFYFRDGDYRLNCIDPEPAATAIVVPIATIWTRVQAECARLYAEAAT